jgi:hypothetical protein
MVALGSVVIGLVLAQANEALLSSLKSPRVDIMEEILNPMVERHKEWKELQDPQKVVDAVDSRAMMLLYGKKYEKPPEGVTGCTKDSDGGCKPKEIGKDLESVDKMYFDTEKSPVNKQDPGNRPKYGYALTPLRMKLFTLGKDGPGGEPDDKTKITEDYRKKYLGEKRLVTDLGEYVTLQQSNSDRIISKDGGKADDLEAEATLGLDGDHTVDCIVTDDGKDCFKEGEGGSLQANLDLGKKNVKQRSKDWNSALNNAAAAADISGETVEAAASGAAPAAAPAPPAPAPDEDVIVQAALPASQVSSIQGVEKGLQRTLKATTDGIDKIVDDADGTIDAYQGTAEQYVGSGSPTMDASGGGGVGAGPASGPGSIPIALEDLAHLFHQSQIDLVEARRVSYLGEGEDQQFGNGGMSKELMDFRDSIKQADRDHLQAMQSYAAMGAEFKALINAAQRRLKQDYTFYRKSIDKQDRKQLKNWLNVLEGREGAYTWLKTKSTEMSKKAMIEIKTDEQKFLDAQREEKAAQKKGFQDAMKKIRKTGQSASKTRLTAEDLESAVDEAKIELRTSAVSSDAVTLLKTKMGDLIDRDSKDVPKVYGELGVLAEAAEKQVKKDIEQHGKEMQAETTSVLNTRAADMMKRRKAEEKVFGAYVKKIEDLTKDENAPQDLQPLESKVMAMKTEVEGLLAAQANPDDPTSIANMHKAAHAAQLNKFKDQVKEKLDVLSGTDTDPEPTSKFSTAEDELMELESQYALGVSGTGESGKGHLRQEADKQSALIDKLVESTQGKLNEVKEVQEKTNTMAAGEQAAAVALDARLKALTEQDEATSIATAQQSAMESGDAVVSETEQAQKSIAQQYTTAEQALAAQTESVADRSVASAGDLERRQEEKTDSWAAQTTKTAESTVKEVAVVADKAQEKIADDEEERQQAEDVLSQASQGQATNTLSWKGRLETFKNDESQQIGGFKTQVDQLFSQIPTKYAKTATDAGGALVALNSETDAELHAPGGKKSASKQAIAEMQTEAEGQAVDKLKQVENTNNEGTKRNDQAERIYRRVTGTYSDAELGALKQADTLYNDLQVVRTDLSAAAILAIDDPKAQQQKLEEREKMLMNEVHKKMDGLDSYAKKKAELAIVGTTKKIKDIMARQDLTAEEKQAAIENLEVLLQNELMSLDGAGEGVQKMLHVVGNKIDSADVEKVEAELAMDRAVKEGLSEEAQARQREGADANEVLYQDLTHAEKIQRTLSALEAAAGGMLSNQESGWRQKLDVVTQQLSHQLGKDLRVGVGDVRDQAALAVNKSDVLVKDVDSDRRQLESAVKGMQEELAETKAYFDAHASSEDAAVEELRKETDVEPVAKPVLNKLTDLYKAASDMHVHIQGAMFAAQHDAADTEEALTKAAEFEVGDEEAAKKFIPEAHALLSRHAATAGWFAAYEAGDMAFKRAVASKMRKLAKELGLDISIDMRGIEGSTRMVGVDDIDAELSKELDANQRKTAQALKSMYADSDAKIAALRANANLSEGERKQMIAAIEAENREKARALFAEQEQMKQRQASLESALAKYQAKVEQAEQQAKEAIASGILSPGALDTTRKLNEAQMQLARVRNKPLFSAIELQDLGQAGVASDKQTEDLQAYVNHLGKMQKADVTLAKEDAKLQMRVSQLERIIGA